MTLTRREGTVFNHVYALAADLGLMSHNDALPEYPTVEDFRRLRAILATSWMRLPVDTREELYTVCLQLITSRTLPWQVLAGLPASVATTYRVYRKFGARGMVEYARSVGPESMALYREVVALREDERADFAERVESALLESQRHRGTPVQTTEELKAALDDLF